MQPTGAGLALLTAALAPAQDIRVLTVEPARALVCQTVDFDLANGNAFSLLRGWLADPALFGPGGTVPRTASFVPQAPLLDSAALVNADVVLLTSMSRPLLRCEVADLAEFVRQGGGLFAFSNTATLDYEQILGATPGGVGSGTATVVDPSSPVASGPFGSVSGAIGGFQYHLTFAGLGPNGNAVVSTSAPVMAEFGLGAGRVIAVGDEEWVMNVTLFGCAAGQLPDVARRALFLNGFASLLPPPGFQYVPNPRALGVRYCSPANLNSRGLPATICATGSARVADDDVTLAVDWISPNAFGYFLTGRMQGFVPFPGGSQGNICLSNPVGRFIGPGQVQNSGAGGFFTLAIDLGQLPQPTGFVGVQPGETWHFQAWYRDANPGPTSNFTDALSVTFF